MAQKETTTGERHNQTSSLYVRSVEKALHLLSAFDAEHRKLTLAQLAKTAGIDLSTAQRFAYTLEQLKLLYKNPDTRTYEPAPRLLGLGFRYLDGHEVIERAMPLMLHLSKSTEVAVNLMVPDHTDVVYAHRLQSRHLVNPEIMVGARLPMFATASGLAIMAYMPAEDVEDILDNSDLRKFTEYTRTDRSEILERLIKIRSDGYATAYQETYLGDISISAAIRNHRGAAIAAISISTSTLTMTFDEAQENYAGLVSAAAATLSQW